MIKINQPNSVMRSYNKIITSNQIAVKALEWEIVCNKTFAALDSIHSFGMFAWPLCIKITNYQLLVC